MHELSIARALVQAVTDGVRDRGGRPDQVTEIHLRIGVLSGVVPDALTFCFDIAADGTPLASAVLLIESVPARGHCPACRRQVTLARSMLICPDCGAPVPALTAGRELEVGQVVLADGPTDGRPGDGRSAVPGPPAEVLA
ncbi:MAG: hydrogenase maturation nickel metallochaperone HypA [Actinomycetota bacterium]|nr:hydrogenase maturation nickel metallochaperone HypA [Actinomycetota bacterium]